MPPASSSTRRGLFAHLRALFVTTHIVAVVLASFPAPVGGLQRAAWSEPTVARELDQWHQRLQSIGMTDDRDRFEDKLYQIASTWVRGRRMTLRPFKPYYRFLGVDQSWRMFIAPHMHPSRLQVHVRDHPSAPWELLYSQGDPTHTWRRSWLNHTRMRSVLFRYSWPGYQRPYRALARFIGREVARERPDAGQVRLQWMRRRTPTPAQVRSGTEPLPKAVSSYTTDLSGLRP